MENATTKRLIAISLGSLLFAGCAGPSPHLPSQSQYIRNFQQVSTGLYRGAQPDQDGMEELKERGIKTIVSLRVPGRVIDWEAESADKLDMEFVSLPMSNYDRPTETDVKEFLKIVTDPTRQPVYLHCRQGQLRTGALIASYRVVEEGWSVPEAYQEAKRLGFDDQYPWYIPLKNFIKDLDEELDELAIPPYGPQEATLHDDSE